MYAKVLVAELQRSGWVREMCRNRTLHRLGMRDDGTEVLDADNNVYVLLHVKVFKLPSIEANSRLERLLQHFCVIVSDKTSH